MSGYFEASGKVHGFTGIRQKSVEERQICKKRSIYKQSEERHTQKENTTTEYAKVWRLVFKEPEQLGQSIIEATDDNDTELK
jgi:hypothetical protein